MAPEPKDSVDYFAQQKAKTSIALDDCGIGHDVDIRLSEQFKVIGEFFGKAQSYASGQATYSQITNVPCGILSHEQANAAHAIKSGVIRAMGELLEWSIDDAIEFAADILEDSNAHSEAAQVRGMKGG